MLYPGRKNRLDSVELNKLGKEVYNRHAEAQTLGACPISFRAGPLLKSGVGGAAWSFEVGGCAELAACQKHPPKPSRAGEGGVGCEEMNVPPVSCVTRCARLPPSQVAFLFCL